MTTFRFRLATLLKLRESDRRQRQVELAEAYQAERLLDDRMLDLANQLSEHKQRAKLAVMGEVDVANILDLNRYELVLKMERASLAEQKQRVEAEIERRREAVVEADQQVRVLEKLRDRRLAEHELEEAKRELKQLDEVTQQQTQRARR